MPSCCILELELDPPHRVPRKRANVWMDPPLLLVSCHFRPQPDALVSRYLTAPLLLHSNGSYSFAAASFVLFLPFSSRYKLIPLPPEKDRGGACVCRLRLPLSLLFAHILHPVAMTATSSSAAPDYDRAHILSVFFSRCFEGLSSSSPRPLNSLLSIGIPSGRANVRSGRSARGDESTPEFLGWPRLFPRPQAAEGMFTALSVRLGRNPVWFVRRSYDPFLPGSVP